MATITDTRVRDILADHASIDGLYLRITAQLDRAEYVAVNKTLERLGGKWNRSAAAHVFTSDPQQALASIIGGGALPDDVRKTEGYVATPASLAQQVVRDFTNLHDRDDAPTVLEPSAGDGAFVRAILLACPNARVAAIDPNAGRAAGIPVMPGRVATLVGTLEAYAAAAAGDPSIRPVDAVVMNPPFALPGQSTAWIDHVRLAWGLVAPGGRLTAIVPAGFTFREDRRHAAMRELVAEHGGYAALDADAFGRNSIRTVVIWLDRPPRPSETGTRDTLF
jgi:hypothetical protein